MELIKFLKSVGISDEDSHSIAVAVERGDELKNKDFEYLYEHFLNSGEMPYGVMKARTDDPFDWIHRELKKMLK